MDTPPDERDREQPTATPPTERDRLASDEPASGPGSPAGDRSPEDEERYREREERYGRPSGGA